MNTYISDHKVLIFYKLEIINPQWLMVSSSHQIQWRSMAGRLWGPSFHAAHETLLAGPLNKRRPASWGSCLHTVQGSTHLSLSNSCKENTTEMIWTTRVLLTNIMNVCFQTGLSYLFHTHWNAIEPASKVQRVGLCSLSFLKSCLAWLWYCWRSRPN